MKKMLFVFSILMYFNAEGAAVNVSLGTFGEVFPIIERDVIEMIQSKLALMQQDGRWQAFEQDLIQKSLKKAQNPAGNTQLTRTQHPRTFLIDMTQTLKEDIRDAQNTLIYAAGTKINPFDFMSFNQRLLFIDGTDKSQIEWALKEPLPKKVILTQGSPFKLMEQTHLKIYFDQKKRLAQKFQLQQVPARITAVNRYLQVEEIVLNE